VMMLWTACFCLNIAISTGLLQTGHWNREIRFWLLWRDIGTILCHQRQGRICKYWKILNSLRRDVLCEFRCYIPHVIQWRYLSLLAHEGREKCDWSTTFWDYFTFGQGPLSEGLSWYMAGEKSPMTLPVLKSWVH
jgi:hypothetical protein